MAGPGGPMDGPASDDDAVIEMLGQALKILVEQKMRGDKGPAGMGGPAAGPGPSPMLG